MLMNCGRIINSVSMWFFLGGWTNSFQLQWTFLINNWIHKCISWIRTNSKQLLVWYENEQQQQQFDAVIMFFSTTTLKLQLTTSSFIDGLDKIMTLVLSWTVIKTKEIITIFLNLNNICTSSIYKLRIVCARITPFASSQWMIYCAYSMFISTSLNINNGFSA